MIVRFGDREEQVKRLEERRQTGELTESERAELQKLKVVSMAQQPKPHLLGER